MYGDTHITVTPDRRIPIHHLNVDVLFVRHSEKRKHITMLDVVLRIQYIK